jgi:hypothetical protein
MLSALRGNAVDFHGDEFFSNYRADCRLLVGGGRHGKFAAELIIKHIHNDCGLKELVAASFMFEYQCGLHEVEAAFAKSLSLISVTVPLLDLVPKLTRPELASIAKVHGVRMYSRLSVNEAKELMLAHTCEHCPQIFSIMSVVRPQAGEKKMKKSEKNARAYTKKKGQNLNYL